MEKDLGILENADPLDIEIDRGIGVVWFPATYTMGDDDRCILTDLVQLEYWGGG
jgi:hypothetical protein